MTDNTTDRGDNDRMFGTFSYQKGGSVIRMIEAILTRKTFTRGLTSYLNDLQFNAATEDDLFYHLEAAAMEDDQWPATNPSFSEVMKTWTNQAGIPVVSASSVSGVVTLTQDWLVSTGAAPDQRTWHIPISLTSVEESPSPGWNNTQPYAWLLQDQDSLELDVSGLWSQDTPFIVNVQGTGYYRVNYDEDNWSRLAETLATDRDLIHPLNRAQIICDVSALAETGHVTPEIRDNVLAYIDQETDFAATYAYQQCAGGFRDEEGWDSLMI